ncbi:MAG: hypothetical protein SFV54_23240 [Bryobacteraceae bacterium]|nr:hypothetical protein [Bryobacteraceae bacterium]
MRGLALLLLPSLALPQPPAPSMPEELIRLNRIRAKMAATLTHLPNYTCTQTVERSSRPGPSRRFRLEDTLRIEVAFVDGREMFAWPGESKFEEKSLEELSQKGSFGTGTFAGFASNVFRSDAPTFRYEGEDVVDGRRTHRYGYEVPQFRSTFLMRVNTLKGIAGYRGSFWSDADTDEVLRLSIEAFDIPPQLDIQASTDLIEYQKVPIGGVPYLLPKTAELTMVGSRGVESKNLVRLTNCRQYAGESTLIFDEAPESGPTSTPAPPQPPAEINVPAGLSLELRLEAPVDTAALAVGDPVRFVLLKDAKYKNSTFIPKGATVTARITFARTFMEARPYQLIALDLAELTFPGATARPKATLQEAGFYPIPGQDARLNPTPYRIPGLRAVAVPAGIRNLFLVPSTGVKLTQGLTFRWRTD